MPTSTRVSSSIWPVVLAATMLLAVARSQEAPDAGSPDARAPAPRAEVHDPWKVIVYGSGRSLFANRNRRGGPVTEDVWDAFAQAIDLSGATHVFGLGDHAQRSQIDQWASTARHLNGLSATVHLLRGDLDDWNLPGFEDIGGGEKNRVVDLDGNRFVLLDDRKRFEEEDLRFLDEACRGRRSNTFILTHSRLFELGDDESNWNRDVVPILKRHGVRYVFCGETNEEALSTRVVPRRSTDPDIYYFCPGFYDSGYRGPGLYVELRFDGDELLSILPRAIPLDVRHPWFHFHPASWKNGATRAAFGDWKPTAESSGPHAGHVRWALPDEKGPDITRMAIWGHSYALHIDNHDDGRIETEELIAAFVDELNRLEFDHAFALGDHVFDPRSAEEWAVVERHYGRLHAKLHMVRGNHEWAPKLPVFERLNGGDERNTQIRIGNNRFVLFGYREVYSPEDLAYLDRAFEPTDGIVQTFFLTHLMSYRYRPVSEAPPGVDPNKPYGGFSNWNTDVAPLLSGRVHYVFFGDIYKRLAGHCVAPNGTYYISTGLMFRGQRPMVYLDLHFRHDELYRVIPRTIPIDLRNGWYSYEKP